MKTITMIILFALISLPAFSDGELHNARYISPIEAEEELQGEWEIARVEDSVTGNAIGFTRPYIIRFYSDGTYVTGLSGTSMREGIWQVFENEHQTYIRMKLHGSPNWVTARLIFRDGVSLLEPRFSDEIEEYDRTILKRAD